MAKYDRRLKALEQKRFPKQYEGDAEIWIDNGDGTTSNGKETITDEELERRAAANGEKVIYIGYDSEDE